MHTLKIVLGGFVLLGICLGIARWLGGAGSAPLAAKCFLGLWLVVTIGNLWVGVSQAGYSVKEELPVAVVVFGVPAIAACVAWWKG